MNKKRIVAIIPARGGSKGVPRKNCKLLRNKPLIAHSIHAALASNYIESIYVSTEDKEIETIGKQYGAHVLLRPPELATDTSTSEEALLHFADNVEFDVLVFLQCTAPFTLSSDIDGAIEKYFEGYDSVLSVCQGHGGFLCNGFRWSPDGVPVNYDHLGRPMRQSLKETYIENGSVYVTGRDALLSSKNRLSGNVGLYIMPRKRSFDIDDHEDFELAEIMAKTLKEES